MDQFSQKLKKKISSTHPDFLKALQQHHWRGNIRELRNTIERACILSETSQLESDSLPWDFLQPSSNNTSGILSLREVEKRHISRMLEHTHGNKTQTAELLGIGLTTLYAKIKEYQL